ncbi:MAG: PP2C family protein-serine/threonine phosphatase [Planctomycetota bacterium]|nr:PP2C family protein-serine/threonine phosphatase [Planctomycetota bacterium]
MELHSTPQAETPGPSPAAPPARNGEALHDGWRFLRAWLRALTDERTFDLRKNPSLWLGFLLGVPIPLLTFASTAGAGLKILSLFAPMAWAIILGAAGRIAILAAEERDALAEVVVTTQEHLGQTEEALGEELEKRRHAERKRDEVMGELQLAQDVQRTLASENIHRDDCEVVSHSIPSMHVGGDYVHVNVVDGRFLYLCIVDVSGHGIAAALVVARIHGLVRRLSLTKKRPESFLERVNRAAVQIFEHTYFFMTMGVFRIDLRTGVMEYATAGHPAQILLRADGSHEELRTPNRLLGMDADIFDEQQPSRKTRLKPGDTIVLYTDGLFEVLSDADGEVLGENGLMERLRTVGPIEPQLLVGEALQELADFQGRSDFEDDMTIVAARFIGQPHRPPAKKDPAPKQS